MFLGLLLLERSALAALRKDLKNTLRSGYSVGTFVNLKTIFCFVRISGLHRRPLSSMLFVFMFSFLKSRTLSPPSVRNC